MTFHFLFRSCLSIQVRVPNFTHSPPPSSGQTWTFYILTITLFDGTPWTFYWPIPQYALSPSSCPRSYLMPPIAKWGLVPFAPIWPQLTWVLAWSMIVAGKPRTYNKNKEWFFFISPHFSPPDLGEKIRPRSFLYTENI